ncbi:MAG: extracellular solute-binding protein [Sphaerochaeta sp.]|nr:extracellular solute-binding protein [Sphaerochaeta sp.]
MKKLYCLIMAMVIVSTVVFASGSDEKSSQKSIAAFDSNASYTVSMGCYGDLEKAYTEVFASEDFKSKFPNVTIKFQTSDFNGHHSRLTTVIAAKEATNDIEALEVGYIAQFVAGGGLTDLGVAPYDGFTVGKDLVGFAMSNATTAKGKLIALPVDIAPAVLFYRKSLIEAAGLTVNDMENIGSWEEYIEIGKKLTKDLDGDGTIDQYAITHANDVAMVPLNGGKGGWLDAKGNPLEPRDKFFNALELVKRIRDAGIDGDMGAWTGPWVESFSNGETATMVNGAWFGGALKTWMAPDLSGDWRVAYLPGKTMAALGGTYLAIPEYVKEENKVVAWEIIKYLSTSPVAQLITFNTIDAYPALTTVYSDPIMNEGVDYFGGQKVRKIYADVAENIPSNIVSEYDAVILSIWNATVTSVLTEEMTLEEGFEKAKSQVLATIL